MPRMQTRKKQAETKATATQYSFSVLGKTSSQRFMRLSPNRVK